MAGEPGQSVRHLPARTGAVVLVCRKCSKRLGGGFGPDGTERLAKFLRKRQSLRHGRGKPRNRPVLIVEVGCLDVCPKRGVAVLHGGRPDDWLVVPRGAALAEVEAELGLGHLKGEA